MFHRAAVGAAGLVGINCPLPIVDDLTATGSARTATRAGTGPLAKRS
jgi:hypothetical protein